MFKVFNIYYCLSFSLQKVIQTKLELQSQDSSGRDRTKMWPGYCAGFRGLCGGL